MKQTIKRFIVMSIISCMGILPNAMAANDSASPPLTATAYIQNAETGETIMLDVSTSPAITTSALADTSPRSISVTASMPRIGGSQTTTENDNGIVYKGTLTVYYDKFTTNGVNSYKLTKVSGGWTQINSRASISNRQVTYGQTGLGHGTISNSFIPSSDSYTYNTNITTYLPEHVTPGICGARSDCTITYRGQQWIFTVVCNIFNNVTNVV